MVITAAIINYNGASFLKACLDGLLAQTCAGLEIVVVDNHSTDASMTLLQEYLPMVHLIGMDSNVGFAAAANVAIKASRADYFFLMNADVSLRPDFIEKLVNRAGADPKIGSLTGKLLRLGQERSPSVIDSTGHVMFRNRWVINRGEGEPDRGQYEEESEVFGVCGGAALYRRAMLEDIRVGEEYLDESFFLYLEDVDLDWRARLRGWKAWYVPAAVGYHQRGYANIFQTRNGAVLRHCFKNRYVMMIKNETARDFFIDAWSVIPYEVLRLGKFALTSPSSLLGGLDVFKLLPTLLKKRRFIQSNRRAAASERRCWLKSDQGQGPIRERLKLFLARSSGQG
jgi:GT2 family glycosyltransferase